MTTTVHIVLPKQNHRRVKVITQDSVVTVPGEREWGAEDERPADIVEKGEVLSLYVTDTRRIIIEEID